MSSLAAMKRSMRVSDEDEIWWLVKDAGSSDGKVSALQSSLAIATSQLSSSPKWLLEQTVNKEGKEEYRKTLTIVLVK